MKRKTRIVTVSIALAFVLIISVYIYFRPEHKVVGKNITLMENTICPDEENRVKPALQLLTTTWRWSTLILDVEQYLNCQWLTPPVRTSYLIENDILTVRWTRAPAGRIPVACKCTAKLRFKIAG